jgi:hypothetical protein
MSKVLIIDTSILCVFLKVPGKDTCGSDSDRWDFRRVDALITKETKAGATLVLPMATLIETGNHIAQSAGALRFETSKRLGGIIEKAADEKTPWAAFDFQNRLWAADELHRIAREWPEKASQGITIGDFTISAVADFYAKRGRQVEILTGDNGLKSLEPVAPARRKRRSEP